MPIWGLWIRVWISLVTFFSQALVDFFWRGFVFHKPLWICVAEAARVSYVNEYRRKIHTSGILFGPDVISYVNMYRRKIHKEEENPHCVDFLKGAFQEKVKTIPKQIPKHIPKHTHEKNPRP